jgi:hypothetical protein
MDAATKQWLDDLKTSGSVSDEDMNVILKIANNPKADEFIKGSALRQADYSRKMQEHKKLVDDLAAKESEVTKFQGDLANWQNGAKEAYKKAVEEREDIAKKLAATQEKLKTIGTLHNIDENEWNSVVVPKKEDKPLEQPQYLTREDMQKFLRDSNTEGAVIDAALHDLNIRHIELFGKPMPKAVEFVKGAVAANKTLTQYFDETFKVAEREAAIQEESVAKRVADAVAANEAKLRSELQISTPRAGDRSSPLFDTTNFHPKQDGNGRTMTAVEAATQAYNKGTYQVK